MRRVLALLGSISLGCLGALGCAETPKRPLIRPPKEEFHVPPDGLFKGPVKYPDELLNNVQPRRPKDDDKFTPPNMGGPSMGGAGSLGMGR